LFLAVAKPEIFRFFSSCSWNSC